ncbi:MAG: hypothetical protein WBC63_06445, partial [Candidatus Bipolaricaulia bacterium]
HKVVVIDEMHGTGRDYMRRILDEICIPYQVIHGERDPLLGDLHAANPEEPHIQKLKDTVRETGAVLGIGLDTDADRYGIVDACGIYIQPNAILAMLIRYLGVERGLKGRVASTYVTSRLLDRIAGDIPGNEAHRPAQGARPMHMSDAQYETALGDPADMVSRNLFMVLTGLKFIIQAAQMDTEYRVPETPPDDWRCRLLIGGEEASGLTSQGHVPDKDGIWACLLVLDMVAFYGKPLTEIWKDLTAAYHPSFTARVNLSISDALKAPFIDSLVDEASIAGRLDEIEVLYAGRIPGKYAEFRFLAADGTTENYLQTRPSGTEPFVRVYFEATSPETLARLQELVEARVPTERR